MRQLPLLPQSGQATLYQQLVQLPSKTSGLGVTFDSSASKPSPADSQDTDVLRRQATRGQNDGHQPASCPRGGGERSSIRKGGDAQLGCLIIPLHPPPQALKGLPWTIWGMLPTIGAKG